MELVKNKNRVDKFLLDIKFEYRDTFRGCEGCNLFELRKVLGIYDTFKQAADAGNNVVDELISMGITGLNDRFEENYAFGLNWFLVSNNWISIRITTVVDNDLKSIVEHIHFCQKRNMEYEMQIEQED